MTRVWELLAFLAMVCPATVLGKEFWEIGGEVQAVKPGASEVVVLRLSDDRTIDVPMQSFSAASQAAIRRALPASPQPENPRDVRDGLVSINGPFGRPVRVSVPECIKTIEADAIQCRTAGDAADVYRLALAVQQLSSEQRSAAEARLREWSARSDKGEVRLGDRWVSQADARAAAIEAEKCVGHALELMLVGNADMAEDELRKAVRINPESGRAGFVMGLAYAVVSKNHAKAVEHFADAVWREQDNASMLANFGVLELLTRRNASAAEHFTAAVECAKDPLPVADDVVWALKLAGAAKVSPNLANYKMSDKTLQELNGVYKACSQGWKLNSKDAATGSPPLPPEVRFLGPSGTVCTGTALADIAMLFKTATPPSPTRHVLGFVIDDGRVVCPQSVLLEPGGFVLDKVWISLPNDPSQRLSASVVTAPDGGGVALLACDGLSIESLSLADEPSLRSDILAVCRTSDSWLDVRLQEVSGRILASGSHTSVAGRFIHTAVVNGNVAGGPIVDDEGLVVGMVATTPRTQSAHIPAGFGIPVSAIRQSLGLTQSAPAVDPDAPNAPGIVKGQAAAATVIVSSAPQGLQPKAKTDTQPP